MKFGIQRFLNPVDSTDSGFMKLSLVPRSKREYDKDYKAIGHSVTYQLADCGERIFLEFGWGGIFDIRTYSSNMTEYLSTLRAKRKKMQGMVDAINKFADKYYAALDADEAAMLDYIEKQKEFRANKE
jgi:hypothetical protein